MTTPAATIHRDSPLWDVAAERRRQDAKWGEQNHPNGTGGTTAEGGAEDARRSCEEAFTRGAGTWAHILHEEVWEAFAEEDPAKLRAELVQIAAVAVAWAEAIDRRTAEQPDQAPADLGPAAHALALLAPIQHVANAARAAAEQLPTVGHWPGTDTTETPPATEQPDQATADIAEQLDLPASEWNQRLRTLAAARVGSDRSQTREGPAEPAPCKWATATAGHGPCQGPATFRIVYRSSQTRKVLDTEQPYCFRHALTHVDRAHTAGSIALVEFEPIPPGEG